MTTMTTNIANPALKWFLTSSQGTQGGILRESRYEKLLAFSNYLVENQSNLIYDIPTELGDEFNKAIHDLFDEWLYPAMDYKWADPTRAEILKCGAEFLDSYGLDDDSREFILEEAIYWFASDYHTGQSSNLYSTASTSEFSPGLLSNSPEDEAATELYYHFRKVYRIKKS